jgi:predicted DNA-binding transcriptional regulator YafY
MNRAQRLLALTTTLRSRRTGTTAAALAERFGVSVRTVMRDLDALRDAHVVVHSERGRGGGVVIGTNDTLAPVSLTMHEALVLLTLGRQARDLRTLPFDRTLTTALEKIRATLSAPAQRELQRQQEHVGFVGVPTLPVDRHVRDVVEVAFLSGAAIAVTVENKDGATHTHTVHIRGVVCDARETLLNATDVDTGRARQLKLHQLRRAQPAKNR